MTRCGIGPTFFSGAILYGVFSGWLTYRYPDLMLINCPYTLLVIPGAACLTAGIVIYIRVLRIFNKAYKKGVLIKEGPFSIIRHPIYSVWILLIIPGVTLLFRSWPMLLTPAVAYAGFRIFVSREEASLEKRFGQDYITYRLSTNELFPFGNNRRIRSGGNHH